MNPENMSGRIKHKAELPLAMTKLFYQRLSKHATRMELHGSRSHTGEFRGAPVLEGFVEDGIALANGVIDCDLEGSQFVVKINTQARKLSLEVELPARRLTAWTKFIKSFESPELGSQKLARTLSITAAYGVLKVLEEDKRVSELTPSSFYRPLLRNFYQQLQNRLEKTRKTNILRSL